MPKKTGGSASTKLTSQTKTARRVLPLPKRIWYKPLSWRRRLPAPTRTPIPKARLLMVQSIRMLVHHKKLLGGTILLYGILNLLLVKGLSGSSNLTNVKAVLDAAFNGASGKLLSGLASFGVLLTTSGSGSTADSGIYQVILLLITSLALIWMFRQIKANHRVRIRDGFYNGMYPLIPFLLVLTVMALRFIPFVLGGALYTLVVNNGIASDFGEKVVFGLILAASGIWSLSMVTSAIFALYIVCLPDMTPIKALRSASLLVYKRRLLIWRKIVPLPTIMLVGALIVELPLILFVTPLAEWVFFGLSMIGLVFLHSYLYTLYRELL